MAFKTFVAGAVLTASDVNTYLAKQAVIVCTSGTRPTSPPEGMTIYETDTDKLLVYTTATTGWVPPWNTAWGVLDYEQVTTNQGSITTITDLTGLSATATVSANRRIRTTLSFEWLGQDAGARHIAYITDSSSVSVARHVWDVPGTGDLTVCTLSIIESPAAGSFTRKGRLERSTGTGVTELRGASPARPAFILIEDIGPNGAPA